MATAIKLQLQKTTFFNLKNSIMSNTKYIDRSGGFNMRKYLFVMVHRKDGSKWENPLKISEVHLISQMAQDEGTEKLTVTLTETTSSGYKYIFG